MAEKITLLIIDDHPLVAEGIATMLKDELWLQIVGVVKNAKDALLFLETNVPTIILLDISLPDIDGIVLCQQIKQLKIDSKIIGLSSANDAGIISALITAGAHGYLLKNMERSELLQAIDAVLNDRMFLSNDANSKLLQLYHSKQKTEEAPIFTRREKEILQLLNEGMNGHAIAEKLFLSYYTVETHRKNMIQKLNIKGTQQLLFTARKLKLI